MVSVIIPVFETEEYLKQCLDSVVGQTYRDIEIILVVANSTDNSLRICEEYAAKDSRIRVIEQIGEGAGNARNQGVSESKGEYICFVDSDDWIDSRFVEKLYNSMVSNGVELVECDDYWGPTGTERIEGNSPYLGAGYDLIRILGAPACWKQMYSKSMWDREGLRFTNTVAEDLFLYSDVYRVCKKSFFLKEPLYYYRIRKGSYSYTAKKDLAQYRELFSLFEMLADRYKERGLFDKYRDELYRQVAPHANNRFRALLGWIDNDTADTLKEEGNSFFSECFLKPNNSFSRTVKVFGSYNLGRIGNYLTADSISDTRYSLSSLIAALSEEGSVKPYVKNDNAYRLAMLEKELNRLFVRDIKSGETDLILIDFLEERHGLLDIGGNYYTGSDVLIESLDPDANYRSIPANSDEYDELWVLSCDKLISVLDTVKNKTVVVLVEMYLSEYVGDIYGRTLKTDSTIETVNARLKRYYECFEKKCPWVKVIKAEDIPEKLMYTENGFEHGTIPEHLNLYYYGYVANMIADFL